VPPVPSVATGSSAPSTAARDPLTRAALILLGVTAFASLLDEIAWTRVLVMMVGGSTYAFTLILAVFLLGIGIGSALVARRGAPRLETAAHAALAQGVTAAGAAVLFLFFTALPVYVIAIFQVQFLDAIDRLALMGLAVGAVVLVPAIGMGMTFPLLVDLVARPTPQRRRRARLRAQHGREHRGSGADRVRPGRGPRDRSHAAGGAHRVECGGPRPRPLRGARGGG
jgi:spermidine synthase